MLIFREFTFDSAHYLPNVAPTHKCRNIHGHTYRLVIYLEGEPDEHLGWVADFAEIKETVKTEVLNMIDHKLLNEIDGLENPTCELLCIWIWGRLKMHFPTLKRIELNETPTSGAIYEG